MCSPPTTKVSAASRVGGALDPLGQGEHMGSDADAPAAGYTRVNGFADRHRSATTVPSHVRGHPPPTATTPRSPPRSRPPGRTAGTREGTFLAPNPAGPLADGFDGVADRPKLYVLDMFPYPSGTGLHVGHPLGYIGTDVFARYQRMTGHNVVHAMGYDAFGLPAEQYAVQTGQHPRVTTEDNIANMRRQLRRLGLAHDPRRCVSTTDVGFYRWTQWIFLQIFGTWYDADADRARPIAELEAELDAGTRQPDVGTNPTGRPWAELDDVERRRVVDAHRLAYLGEAPVNWCPGLGTVLANEEVTDGRSERGNFPVFRRPLKQWMMRITAYADRLIDDLDLLDWPESIKAMQRNWIGRSHGAEVRFATPAGDLEVFTTRPDTLFGATYMVLAPEHPLVDTLVADGLAGRHRRALDRRRGHAGRGRGRLPRRVELKSDMDRQADDREKTGVFTGAFATNPVNGAPSRCSSPTTCSWATAPGRSWPCPPTTSATSTSPGPSGCRSGRRPAAVRLAGRRATRGRRPATGDGAGINSANAEVASTGWPVAEAKAAITDWLEAQGLGEGTVTYKLRDWLFSRQRYWGEPFPIVYDESTGHARCPSRSCPCCCPRSTTTRPRTFDGTTTPPSPSRRSAGPPTGLEVTLDLGDGPKLYRRELNTMPQWAGSCWYELRYLDPTNDDAFVDPEVERYWMGPQFDGDCGGVDLYVGGVEHAVLHLLYARFWHKVLFDLGHVSSSRAVPPPLQPGLHPGRRLHRRAGLLRRGRRRSRSGTAATSSRANGSPASTGRWASR